MRKFDPIDIFFIAIITTYFITLICIGITFLYIKFSKNKSSKITSKKQNNVVNVVEIKEKAKKEQLPKKVNNKVPSGTWKEKILSSALFHKLFMKEVKAKKQVEPIIKKEPVTKLKIEEKVSIEPEKIKKVQDQKEKAVENNVVVVKDHKMVQNDKKDELVDESKKTVTKKNLNTKTTTVKKNSNNSKVVSKNSGNGNKTSTNKKSNTNSNKKSSNQNKSSTKKKAGTSSKNSVKKTSSTPSKKSSTKNSKRKKKITSKK